MGERTYHYILAQGMLRQLHLVGSVSNNILIVKPSSIGDVVHSLPVLAGLRRRFPEAKIHWLVEVSAAALVEGNPLLDGVLYFRRRTGGAIGTLLAQPGLLGELRAAKFDLVVDLQGLLRSAFFSYATRAGRRIGLSDAREGAGFFYTEVAQVSEGMHAVDRYLKVGELLGFDTGEAEFPLEAGEEARARVDELLAGISPAPRRPYIALCPGARWPSKNWPAENFAEAGRRLREQFGGTIFIIGAEAAKPEAAEIERRTGGAVNLAGNTSLGELVALLGRMDLAVTGDTGAMHIADALGVKVVAIFGPTDAGKTGPYSQRGNVIRAQEPCGEAPCMKRNCPLGDTICMRAVSGEEAARKGAAILQGVS